MGSEVSDGITRVEVRERGGCPWPDYWGCEGCAISVPASDFGFGGVDSEVVFGEEGVCEVIHLLKLFSRICEYDRVVTVASG